MTETCEYKIVSNLSKDEAEDLAEFLGSRMETPLLEVLVQEKSEPVGTVYRGIKYTRKELKELECGKMYEHWNLLSSWSTSRDVAIGFAFNEYVPEGIFEDIHEELYGEYEYFNSIENERYDRISKEIVNVLLICTDGYGFDVTKHLEHKQFSNEKEVIHYDGKWNITLIEKKTEIIDEIPIDYFEVHVSVAQEAVA